MPTARFRIDNGEYMSFGLSGEDSKSVMVGGDVVVAWVDKETLKGYAEDYFLDAKSQCSGPKGSCPDEKLAENTNNIRLLNAAMVNGYSIVTYQRPLKPADELDRQIFTNKSQAIIWAIGPLNQRNEVSFHSHYTKGNQFLDFGRAPKWNCPMPEGDTPPMKPNSQYQKAPQQPQEAALTQPQAQPTYQEEVQEQPQEPAKATPSRSRNSERRRGGSASRLQETTTQREVERTPSRSRQSQRGSSTARSTPRPVPTPAPVQNRNAWEIPAIQCYEPEDGVFYAQMGPTGGKRGYPAITGHVGWGIAWYINGLLIPEINVVRGKTYTFVVEGGLDPETPAKYHPFYITDDAVGGYEYKSPEEKQNIRIFSGAKQARDGTIIPTGVGRLCHWTHQGDSEADDFDSFGAYQRTLELKCDQGEPGVIEWTPDANTPDTVYYQCFTHRYLGWKIKVLDSCDAHASGSEPQPAIVPAPEKDDFERSDDLEDSPSIRVETLVNVNGIAVSTKEESTSKSVFEKNDKDLQAISPNPPILTPILLNNDSPLIQDFPQEVVLVQQELPNISSGQSFRPEVPSFQASPTEYFQENQAAPIELIEMQVPKQVMPTLGQRIQENFAQQILTQQPLEQQNSGAQNYGQQVSGQQISDQQTSDQQISEQQFSQQISEQMSNLNQTVLVPPVAGQPNFYGPLKIMMRRPKPQFRPQLKPKPLPHHMNKPMRPTSGFKKPQYRPLVKMPMLNRPIPSHIPMSKVSPNPMSKVPSSMPKVPPFMPKGQSALLKGSPNSKVPPPKISPKPFMSKAHPSMSKLPNKPSIYQSSSSQLRPQSVMIMKQPQSFLKQSLNGENTKMHVEISPLQASTEREPEIRTEKPYASLMSIKPHKELYSELDANLPLAVNTGFHPESVVIEGGFKPIISKGIDRTSDDGPELELESEIGMIDKVERIPDGIRNFGPVFVPSPIVGQQKKMQMQKARAKPKPQIMFVMKQGRSDDTSLEVTSRGVISQKVTSQEESQDGASLDVPSQEVSGQEVVSQKVASQEVASQEFASQEVSNQDITNQEVKRSMEEDEEPAAAERVESYYLPPVGRKVKPVDHVRKASNIDIPPGTVVAYDGKRVSGASLTARAADRSSIFEARSSKATEFIRARPQFAPFKGELPPLDPKYIDINAPQLQQRGVLNRDLDTPKYGTTKLSLVRQLESLDDNLPEILRLRVRRSAHHTPEHTAEQEAQRMKNTQDQYSHGHDNHNHDNYNQDNNNYDNHNHDNHNHDNHNHDNHNYDTHKHDDNNHPNHNYDGQGLESNGDHNNQEKQKSSANSFQITTVLYCFVLLTHLLNRLI